MKNKLGRLFNVSDKATKDFKQIKSNALFQPDAPSITHLHTFC